MVILYNDCKLFLVKTRVITSLPYLSMFNCPIKRLQPLRMSPVSPAIKAAPNATIPWPHAVACKPKHVVKNKKQFREFGNFPKPKYRR